MQRLAQNAHAKRRENKLDRLPVGVIIVRRNGVAKSVRAHIRVAGKLLHQDWNIAKVGKRAGVRAAKKQRLAWEAQFAKQ